MVRGPHCLRRRQVLKFVQQRKLQPAMSALGSSAFAVQMALQDWKSLVQTRTLWLPGLQGEGVG